MNLSNNITNINSSTIFNNVKKSTINNPREWDFWDYSFMVCFIFGMIGNSLSIIVMSAKKLRNTNAALFVCKISQIMLNKNFIRLIFIIQ